MIRQIDKIISNRIESNQVFLESVLLEIRANDWQRAAYEAQEALKVHSGAGRLWAVLVQLKQRESDQAQQASLKQARPLFFF